MAGGIAMALGLAGLLTLGDFGCPASARSGEFVAHEWGTFTTRHGADGAPVVWSPLAGPNDLPRFVYRNRRFPKNSIEGTVRMETPVIYFYADQRQGVAVDVDFPGGEITEWYPRGRIRDHGIAWPRVTILPGAAARLPRQAKVSHYYPARATDAEIVRVRDAGRTQDEKFLFYRGVGTFDLPLTAQLDGGQVVVNVSGDHAIDQVVLFEQRAGAAGHRTAGVQSGSTSVERPVLAAGSLDAFEDTLRTLLLEAGLYEREAQAMLDTWRETWAEDGLRVFYLVPRAVTDTVLPLAIEPPPSTLVRVLVGRAEIVDGP